MRFHFLFSRSVGVARRGGLRFGFIDEPGYFDAILDSLVQDKANRGGKSRFHAGAELGLDKPRGVLETYQALVLLLRRTHYRDVNLAVLQVARNLGPRDRHAFDARV